MVREFVLLRGGVSQRASGLLPATGWLAEDLALCYFTGKHTAGILAQTSLKVTWTKLHESTAIYFKIHTHTQRGDRENRMLHKIFPMQLSKWEREMETREEREEAGESCGDRVIKRLSVKNGGGCGNPVGV